MKKQTPKKVAAKSATPTAATTIRDLVADPHNRRRHPARNVDLIVSALREVGAARSIVIDEQFEVLAGNGVLQAAIQAGLSKVQIVDADGDTIIAVRRTGLSDAQKRALAIYDNRTGELAEWDVEQLAADLKSGEDLKAFFLPNELIKLLKDDNLQAADLQPAEVADGVPQFVILVTCLDEPEQTALLERFITEGLVCRAVVS